MFKRPAKEKEKVQIDLTCSTCGKPVAGKARSDVTRYLFEESRCQCNQPKLVVADNQEEAKDCKALPYLDYAKTGEDAKTADAPSSEDPKPMAGWQLAILANLPQQYEALSLIGEGGMGTVWKVRDNNLNKIFAIKILRSAATKNREAMQRFIREAQAACQFTHPNLAAVYSFEIGRRGAPYIVMDYIEGDNLAKMIQKEGCVDVPRATDLFIQIAEAVTHAHTKGIIHRDIKPTNIIVQRNQEGIEIVKLVDFGIAKLTPNEGVQSQGLTRTGDVFGTPSYMSPEQCLGKKLDARSDVFSFGCVMYETLCGKKPFPGNDAMQTMLKRINSEAEPIGQASTQQKIPDDLGYIVMRCLERQPENRYQSMRALEIDLQLLKEHKAITRVKKTPDKARVKPEKSSGRPSKIESCRVHSEPSYRFPLVLAMCLTVFMAVILSVLFGLVRPSIRAPEIESSQYDVTKELLARRYTDGRLARELDKLSETYIRSNQYDKAVPLLLLSASYYEDAERSPLMVSDDCQSLGKCYKMLGQYTKAEEYYRKAFELRRDHYNWTPMDLIPPDVADDAVQPREISPFSELVRDWAEVLVKLNRADEASQLTERWGRQTEPVESDR